MADFQSPKDLTNTKQLPFGKWQNAVAVPLVNSSNHNICKIHTCHAVLFSWKSYATCFPSGTRGTSGYLIIDQLKLACIQCLLRENMASHCLSLCFSHWLRQIFKVLFWHEWIGLGLEKSLRGFDFFCCSFVFLFKFEV